MKKLDTATKRGIWSVAVLLAIAGTVYAAEYYGVGAWSQDYAINEHGIERCIDNNNGLAIFVPTRTSAEWQSLINNGAPNVNITGCAAAPIYGCTDPSANNYNPSATVDDGSCTYGGGGGNYCLDVTADLYMWYPPPDTYGSDDALYTCQTELYSPDETVNAVLVFPSESEANDRRSFYIGNMNQCVDAAPSPVAQQSSLPYPNQVYEKVRWVGGVYSCS